MALKKQYKLLKTIPLNRLADDLAADVVQAVYSAVGNRTVTGLREGQELDEVVDHSLSQDGMSDTWSGLASTRIEFKIGEDVSGSMFGRYAGSPIVRATTVTRLLRNASIIVSSQLPPNVFKSTAWLWAAGRSTGEKVVCLDSFADHLANSTIHSTKMDVKMRAGADEFLSWMSKLSTWELAGGGTYLSPLLQKWATWESINGDPTAHRMDLVLTDGQIHDVDACNLVQSTRRFGHYRGLLLNVSDWVGHVPHGFTGYHTSVFDIETVIRNELAEFVKEMANFTS